MIELKDCDQCGGQEFSQVYPASYGNEHFEPEIYYSPKRSLNLHFSILKCKTCGLVRSSALDEDKTQFHLFHLNGETHPKEINNRRITFTRWIKQVSHEAVLGGKLLDVGCSTGLFIGEATRLGWQTVGIDPCEKAAAEAQRFVPWAKIYVSDIETAIFPAQSFRIITMWDQLARVRSPHKVLERSTSWMEPGGYLLLTVPNIQSFEAGIMGSFWPELLRENSWYFSQETITKLLDVYGFHVVSIRPAPIYTTLGAYSQLLRRCGGWVSWIGWILNLGRLTQNLSFWVNTGNLLVTARLKEKHF